MSREAYQVPSLGAGAGSSSQNAFGAVDGAAGGAGAGGAEGPLASYVCGECSSRVSLKRGDQIRCKECGHRVLYKERTKRYVLFPLWDGDPWGVRGRQGANVIRMVQFEAR